MDYSLSDKDVKKLACFDTKVIVYPELNNMKELSELINYNSPYCIILYETNKNNNQIYGHWCSIKLLKNGKICFMDSYGDMIDDVLTKIPYEIRYQTNQLKYKLSELIKNSPYNDINYNEHKYQKMNPNITTCGRYAALFIRMNDFDTDMFYNFMKIFKDHNGKSYDENIVYLTDNYF